MDAERDLTFALLALQRGLITVDRMAEISAGWKPEQPGGFPEFMAQFGGLKSEDARKLIVEMEATLLSRRGSGGATMSYDSFGPGMESGSTRPMGTFTMGGAVEVDRANAATVPASGEGAGFIPAVVESPGRYKLVREHSSGGMGRISLVRDEHLGREVAMKELLPDALRAAGTRPGAPTTDMLTIPIVWRFLQEAQITGRLEHPSIIPVYELGYRADGSLYYTMRFVRGKTLQDSLSAARTLEERRKFLTHFLNLSQAIAYSHSRGVIHRDIKPLNVMVGEFGETIVIDWGIAKVKGKRDIAAADLAHNVEVARNSDIKPPSEGESTLKTTYGEAMGSPYFMPPEQAQGLLDEINECSDIYSLGAVLYTILAGQVPYFGMSVNSFLKAVPKDEPKPIRSIEPAAPPELVAVVERAMKRKPGDRYASAKDLADDVDRYLNGDKVSVYQYAMREVVMRFVRKHKSFLITSTVALIVLIGVAMYSYTQVVRERNLAIAAKEKEIHAHDKAERARIQAEEARKQEEEARKNEEIARRKAQQELYSANVALSERCMSEQRMSQARELLAGCPEPYRHWEWGRLEYLFNADRTTFREGGQYAAFVADGTKLFMVGADGSLYLRTLASPDALVTLADKTGYGFALALSANGARTALVNSTGLHIYDMAAGSELRAITDAAAAAVPAGTTVVRCVALSADGALAATLGADRQVRIYSAGSGEELAAFPLERSPRVNMAFSPDARTLVVAHSSLTDEGMMGTITVFDIAAKKVQATKTLRAPLFAHAAVFSPDGRVLALGTDESLFLWDTQRWQQTHELKSKLYYPDSVAFSADGAWVAAGGQDGTLSVWDAASGASRFTVKAHLDAIHDLAFTPDGSKLVTGGSDRTGKVWAAADGKLLHVLKGHNAPVFSCAVSPDGTLAATASYDGTTKVWGIDSALDGVRIYAADYAPDKNLLVGSVGNKVNLWNTQSEHLIRSFGVTEAKIRLVALAPKATRLATVAHETIDAREIEVLRLYDLESGSELRMIEVGESGVSSLTWSPDGTQLGVVTGSILTLWRAEDGQQTARFEQVVGHAFAPNGTLLAFGLETGSIKVYDLAAAAEKYALEAPVKLGITLAFTPDSQRLVAGCDVVSDAGYMGLLKVWNMADGAQVSSVENAHKGHINAITFSADGAWMATGGKDKVAKIWTTADLQEKMAFKGHAGDIISLTFTPDAQRLATASGDGTFKFWDCIGGRELITLQDSALAAKGESCVPSRIMFSNDMRQMVVLTEPEVLAPVILHAFPWNLNEYPGEVNAELRDRVEQFKRSYWSGQ